MRRTRYPIHPDFKRWTKMNPPLNRAVLPIMQVSLGLLLRKEKSTRALTVERLSIPSTGKKPLRALLYSPVGLAENAPCLVYFHGGGFVMPAASYHYRLAREYALGTLCKVLFVDYRLAPKHPFPAAVEDCHAAYQWALSNAQTLSIDPVRIAVGGDSAGGELAAVTCLMAKTRPCGQLLIYPVTGREETESRRKFIDTPMCNSRDMEKYERFYLSVEPSSHPEYAAPLCAASLAHLPPAYIETAEFDCLRDEAIAYAQRLSGSGVPTELHNTSGTMHGFDIVTDSSLLRACIDRRIAFLKRIFA